MIDAHSKEMVAAPYHGHMINRFFAPSPDYILYADLYFMQLLRNRTF